MSVNHPTRPGLVEIEAAIPFCERCPRLRRWCAQVAREKRKAFAGEQYWGRPVPGFGDPRARIWIVGLAPAAHGGNRTGRVFTGDRSGDFLYAGLFRAGYANQPTSTARADGLELEDVFISAALRCAPPANRPLPIELERCSSWLDQEFEALDRARVIVCLGAIAWDAAVRMCERHDLGQSRPRPRFAHGALLHLRQRHLLGCYHVSQQNTFTGRLTSAMFDELIARAKELSRAP